MAPICRTCSQRDSRHQQHAPAGVIARLPGLDDALAQQIVRARDDTHGFTSVEDLGVALDLDGNLVEDLRECVVFLPRSD